MILRMTGQGEKEESRGGENDESRGGENDESRGGETEENRGGANKLVKRDCQVAGWSRITRAAKRRRMWIRRRKMTGGRVCNKRKVSG